jgi:hypothetical protein
LTNRMNAIIPRETLVDRGEGPLVPEQPVPVVTPGEDYSP